MRAFFSSLNYWKVAFLRCAIYAGVVFGTTFMSQTEEMGTQAWADTGWFLKSRIFVACSVAALTTVVAFLDSTMSTLRNPEKPPVP